MSILSVDTIQPIGSGSTVTLNAAKIVVGTGITFESNGQAIYAGIITATSFSGSGANLTSLPAQATIANNSDNRVITGGSGVNLNGEANLVFNGNELSIAHTNPQFKLTDTTNNTDAYLFSDDNGSIRLAADLNSEASDSRIRMSTDGTERVSIAEHLTISDGNLVIGTSGHGIDFSAAGNAGGMTSELLDDYEEGSFSPTLANGNNGYRFQQGTYTKIGNLVTFTAYIETSATPPSGNLVFGSLPYTSISGRSWVFPFHTNRTSFGTASFDARAYMGGNATTIIMYYPVNSSSSNFQPINQNGMNAANASAVWISGSYQTAS